ncbi:trafficking protein particle complex subunit 13 [Agrilus planipennis]|uniref:Trafficking protein particle complex subunit 13 n=1 Tax=Agrilus planipennis TaxID=224129 RepID=A0A1W4X930_AGRPL|nr:trafficking protein particle complex subunit 13 [Agrilus planipennis]
MEPEEHLLGLKVMRLTKPTLASPLPITCDTKDLPGNLLNKALKDDPTAVSGLETICIGQFLLLPQSPVNIYLGETFSSYICVYNDTKDSVNNVAVKVDLQTSSQRLPLAINPPIPILTPDEKVNIVIHHEVKEIGTHILVCEVSYEGSNRTPTSFRKFFKIQVLKPLDVKTKFYNAESDDVYLEAQVQNITSGPIFLERVELDATHLFNVASVNVKKQGGSIFGKLTMLQPQATCQYLYCLSPDAKLSADTKLLSGATNVGKFDIVWRSNLGERGRLQTSQLQRISPEYDDIRLFVQEYPNFVLLEEAFHFKCRLTNNSEYTMELTLSVEECDGITWCEISGQKLQPLSPKGTVDLELKLVPLVPGLRSISGIRLVDTFNKKTYSFDDFIQVFVMVNDKKQNEQLANVINITKDKSTIKVI